MERRIGEMAEYLKALLKGQRGVDNFPSTLTPITRLEDWKTRRIFPDNSHQVYPSGEPGYVLMEDRSKRKGSVLSLERRRRGSILPPTPAS